MILTQTGCGPTNGRTKGPTDGRTLLYRCVDASYAPRLTGSIHVYKPANEMTETSSLIKFPLAVYLFIFFFLAPELSSPGADIKDIRLPFRCNLTKETEHNFTSTVKYQFIGQFNILSQLAIPNVAASGGLRILIFVLLLYIDLFFALILLLRLCFTES